MFISRGVTALFVTTLAASAFAVSSARALASPNASPTLRTPYSAAVIANKPSAYWRLDEAGGSTAADSSGHGVTGTYQSVSQFQAGGALVGDTDSAIGAYSDTSPAVTAPDATMPPGIAPRTIEFWSEGATCCTAAGVTYGDLSDGRGFRALYEPQGGNLRVDDGVSSESAVVGQPYSLSDGNWHLFDFVLSGSRVLFYIDGVSIGVRPLRGVNTIIGGSVSLYSMDGLDEVAIYPSALSATRVSAHWTAGSSATGNCANTPNGPYPNTVLADSPAEYFRSDDLANNPGGRVAYDSSGHCRNGTIEYPDSSVPGALVGDTDAGVSNSLEGVGLGLPSGSQARTVEFWFKSSGCCAQMSVAYGASAPGSAFGASYNNESGQLVASDGSSRPRLVVDQPFDLNDGRWHLLDATYATGRVTLYVDGVAAGAGAVPGLNTNTSVGLNVVAQDLDEVAIYPSALGATRIAAHWTAGSSVLARCAGAPRGSYPAAVTSDSPAAYYRLGDIATNSRGRVAFDSSGNCANGSLRYTDRTTTSALVGDSDGALAGDFSAPAPGLPSGSASRTIEFWATASGCCRSVGVGYGDRSNGDGFELTYNTEARVVTVDDGQDDFSQASVSEPYDLDDARWHLFDVTFDGGQAVIYVDGVAVGEGPITGLTTDSNTAGLYGFGRTLDEVAIYPTVLSAVRIAAHWTAGSSSHGACPAGPTGSYASSVLAAHPTSYYRLDDIANDSKGRVTYDSSGNCNNGSLRYTDSTTNGAIVGDPDAATAGAFSAPASSLPAGAAVRTVEFWLNTSGCCPASYVAYGNFAEGNGFDVEYDSETNALKVDDGSSNTARFQEDAPTFLADGEWHLIDLTFGGRTATFYVDGSAAGSGPLANLTTDPSVGMYATSDAIDEVAIYPIVLGQAQISAHWTAGSHG